MGKKYTTGVFLDISGAFDNGRNVIIEVFYSHLNRNTDKKANSCHPDLSGSGANLTDQSGSRLKTHCMGEANSHYHSGSVETLAEVPPQKVLPLLGSYHMWDRVLCLMYVCCIMA